MQVEQVRLAPRRGEEHTRDVLGSLVVSHTDFVARPAQIVLLRHLLMATEYEVQSFAHAALQEQQPDFLAQPDDAPDGRLYLPLVSIVEVDVHAHGVGRSSTATQQTVLAGNAGIVKLSQTPLVVGVPLTGTLDHCDMMSFSTDRQIVLYGAHRQHHLCSFAVLN